MPDDLRHSRPRRAATPDVFAKTPGGGVMLTFIQMHGEPGSGKSTLARALGARLPAVVIDKDLIASGAILAGVPFANAGAVAYEALWLLLPSVLDQGHSVIHDSPCYWPKIEDTGRAIAARRRARYEMVEVTADPDIVESRLATRQALESNPVGRLTALRPGMYRPSTPHLVLDSSRRHANELAEAAVAWLRESASAAEPSTSLPLAREVGRGGRGVRV